MVASVVLATDEREYVESEESDEYPETVDVLDSVEQERDVQHRQEDGTPERNGREISAKLPGYTMHRRPLVVARRPVGGERPFRGR